MKVIRIDGDKNETVVYDNIKTRAEGINRVVQFAQDAQRNTPNNPHIDQSGPDEISVFIGVNRVISFKLTD